MQLSTQKHAKAKLSCKCKSSGARNLQNRAQNAILAPQRQNWPKCSTIANLGAHTPETRKHAQD
eukprot:7008184-Pyramimonas_sp.AAC.1